MAWTTPMTAVANAVWTAAQFNSDIRDNLNETGPAKATSSSLTGNSLRDVGVNSVNITGGQAGTASTTTAATVTGDGNFNLPTTAITLTRTLGPTDTPTFFFMARMRFSGANSAYFCGISIETVPGGFSGGAAPILPTNSDAVTQAGMPANSYCLMHGFWRPDNGYFNVSGSYSFKLRFKSPAGTFNVASQKLYMTGLF